MSIKAIVFDKDGTLIDYSSYWYYVGMAATEHAYRMLGITDIPKGEIEAHVRELGVTKTYTDIEGGLPLGDHKGLVEALYRHAYALGKQPTVDECIAAFSAAYGAEDVKKKGNICPATPHLAATLRALKARGIRLILVIFLFQPPKTESCRIVIKCIKRNKYAQKLASTCYTRAPLSCIVICGIP